MNKNTENTEYEDMLDFLELFLTVGNKLNEKIEPVSVTGDKNNFYCGEPGCNNCKVFAECRNIYGLSRPYINESELINIKEEKPELFV